MKKILIAEDEKMIRYGIRVMIENSNVKYSESIECKNGKEAVDYIKRSRIDLILTDVKMPFMDGVELVSWMQKNLETEDMPLIIAVSGYSDFQYAKSMLRAGAINYLLKPIDREEMYDSLMKAEKIINERKFSGGGGMSETEDAEEEKAKFTYINRKKMEDAIEYINNNYRKHIDMAEVSNHVSMNYTMFSSVFCKYTGMNFSAYLKKVRIGKAEKLLLHTDMKIKEICQDVGIDDVPRFVRIFKDVTGETPTTYRKKRGI